MKQLVALYASFINNQQACYQPITREQVKELHDKSVTQSKDDSRFIYDTTDQYGRDALVHFKDIFEIDDNAWIIVASTLEECKLLMMARLVLEQFRYPTAVTQKYCQTVSLLKG